MTFIIHMKYANTHHIHNPICEFTYISYIIYHHPQTHIWSFSFNPMKAFSLYTHFSYMLWMLWCIRCIRIEIDSLSIYTDDNIRITYKLYMQKGREKNTKAITIDSGIHRVSKYACILL